ncbi:MAG: hypothetical protein JRN24_02485 [Nitrososphaerota archaeon]|nr:hypothetical protein [Nitrososphaerota archaeon]
MKRFELERVSYQGRDYKRGELAVDEEAKQVEIIYVQRKLLSSKSVSLAKFGFDSATKVSRYGSSLTIGGSELVAAKLEDAITIESIIGGPHRSAREAALKSLGAAEDRARDFINERGTTIAFLRDFKADPTGAIFRLYLKTRSPAEAALREYMKSRNDAVAAALANLDFALTDLDQKAGQRVAERVYAVAYVAGRAQDKLLETGDTGLKSEGFVTELGIKESDLAQPADQQPVNLVAAAHQSTATAVE